MPTPACHCACGDRVGRTDLRGFLPEQARHAVTLALDNGYVSGREMRSIDAWGAGEVRRTWPDSSSVA